jgi:acetyl esterase/lipase
MKNKHLNNFIIAILIFMVSIGCIHAQNEEIELWSSEVPGSIKANDYFEVYNENLDQLRKVVNPTLTMFVPENPNGTSIVICPGGGYAYLAIKKEGFIVAQWLNTLGITTFVLKYRLPSDDIMEDKSVGPLQDAQEAIRIIRRNAEKWQLNTERIGVLGFSAGGHVAATLSTHYKDEVYHVSDTTSAKPDFTILVYPVISMDEKIGHQGSRNRLLGINASKELKENFSNEKHIDSLTPPAFIVHASNDNGVLVENSLAFYLGLKNNKVSAELHLYQDGKHGFGLGKTGTSQFWTQQCERWLRTNKYIN